MQDGTYKEHSTGGYILNIISVDAAYSIFSKKLSIIVDIQKTDPHLIAQLNQRKFIAA
jgi:hypothetical protein